MRTFRNMISTTIVTNRRTKQNGTRCGGVITASTPAISAHIQGSPYTFAKAAIIAMTKQNACVNGCNNAKAFIARRDIATGATYDSMSTDQKMNVVEEPSMKTWGNPEVAMGAVVSRLQLTMLL